MRGFQQKLNATEQTLNSPQSQASTDKGALAAARSQAAQDQTIAQQATQSAQAKAKAQCTSQTTAFEQRYASKMAVLKQEQQTMTRQEKTVATEQGQIQSSSISASGVYVVGQDMKSGTWHTNGDGGMTDNECYYATLNSTNTSDIADNNNFDGAETVDAVGAYAFQISGPCTWYFAG